MQLLVRQALSGRTAVVQAAPGDTVADLKHQLAQVGPDVHAAAAAAAAHPPPRSSTHLPTALLSLPASPLTPALHGFVGCSTATACPSSTRCCCMQAAF